MGTMEHISLSDPAALEEMGGEAVVTYGLLGLVCFSHIEPLLYEQASIFSMPCPRSSYHSMNGGSIEEGSPHLSEELCPELSLGSTKLDVGKIEPSTVMSWDEKEACVLGSTV